MEEYDVIIIGGGPAGLTAGIYAARRNLKTLIVTMMVGGQAVLPEKICNYPGFLSVSGMNFIKRVQKQAEKAGAQIILEEAKEILPHDKEYLVKTQTKEFLAKAVILAFGKKQRKLNVPGEEKFIGKGVSYCATCLPPGEEVVANDSLEKIERIGISQKVLTAEGDFRNINQIMSRNYEGEIIKIKTRFFTEPVRLTPNHPVLTTNIDRNYYKKNFTVGKYEWKHAGVLTEKDILLYPIISETRDVKKIKLSEILDVEVINRKVKNIQETYTSHRISNEIPVNKKFLRLVGYYLSEGCVSRHEVSFSFNKNEKEYINDTKNLLEEIFSLKVHLKTEGGITKVSIFSKLVRDLFSFLFGKGASNKKLPNWMLFLPLNKQKEIIKGLYRGDGCLRDKDFCIVTTSRILAYQLRDILLRFGIIPSIVKREKAKLNKKLGEINGRKIVFNYDKYHIVIGGPSLEKMSEILEVRHPKLDKRKRICKHAWIVDNYLLLPIREINKEIYKGKVYNLVTEGNTYVAKNFIVHNCDAPLFKNKTVAVVGGGNSALDAALLLSKYAKKVYLIHRRDEFRGFESFVDEVKKKKNVEFLLSSVVVEIKGENLVKSILVKDLKKEETREIAIDGIFVEIGYDIDPSLVKNLVKLDEHNQIVVNQKCQTFYPDKDEIRPGIFAAGDVTNNIFKQIVVAAGEGAKAALAAYNYIYNVEDSQIVGDWSKR